MVTFKNDPFWQYCEYTKKFLRVCLVAGLLNEEKDRIKWFERGDEVLVDAGIADLIVLLNNKGFKTIFCCSGLMEDHCSVSTELGYISFAHKEIDPDRYERLRNFLYVSGFITNPQQHREDMESFYLPTRSHSLDKNRANVKLWDGLRRFAINFVEMAEKSSV